MLGLGLGVPQASTRGRTTDPLRALTASLFGNGEQGAMFIPQPTLLGDQNLWQMSDGTVIVDADGDPVGRNDDVSGNGSHAAQSVSADRPLYKTDGGLHWLAFDGAGAHLSGPAPGFTSSSFSALVAGRADSTGTKGIFKTGSEVLGKGDQFLLFRPAGLSSGVGDSTGTYRSYTFGVPAGVDFVVEIHFGNGKVEFVLDGAVVNTITASLGTVAFTEDMVVGRSDTAVVGQFWDGDVSGVIFRDGLMTETQKSDARNYLAKRQGRTL